MTRRDRLELVGKRAQKLSPKQAQRAWYDLAFRLEAPDDPFWTPKFKDLVKSIRAATIAGRAISPIPKDE